MLHTPLKQVHSPFHGHNVKFGRKRPTTRPKLHLKNYFIALPTPPGAVDYTTAPGVGKVLTDIYCNDKLGCCVVAGGYHLEGVATGNAGAPFLATDAQIITDYSAIGGYVPGKPDTDQGCQIPDAFAYWQKTGFANGTKLLGSIAIDASDKLEVMVALWLFENLVFGLELPDPWIDPFPSANGFIWDNAGPPDPENGHCIVGTRYDSHGIGIDSWGMEGVLTYAAAKKYCAAAAGGELHAVLTPDQLAKGQAKAPNGLDWAALIADFNSMGGSAPVPAPTPSPTPGAPALTLAQTQALMAQNWPKSA